LSFLNELKRRNVLRVGVAYIVAAWLIIQVAETIFPLFGFGDTPARLVVVILAIAFIPSLIFSWVFEITPEGLKKDADVDRDQSITPVTGKKLDRIILVVLALALGYFAFDKFVLDPTRDAELVEETVQKARSDALVESYGDKSIAVLPFVNMSSDPEQAYFSDGVTEELLNLLSKIPELRVISRSSAFSFKGKDIDIPTIATQLNVAYILEGSVRKAGTQVRITAQLIEARSDTHLWSETYDRNLENIFEVQDEISTAITGALMEHLSPQTEVLPQITMAINNEAHDAYLRGRYLVVQRTQRTIEGAVGEFEKAITIDPNYALAHAELAVAYILLARQNYGDLTYVEAIAKATPHAEQAMVLDPTLAEAHAATALLLRQQENAEGALGYLKNALRVNPNYSLAHTWMANIFSELGRYEEADVMQKTALSLDPLWKGAINNYTQSLVRRNLLDDAHRELEKIASIYPAMYSELQGRLTGVGGNWANLVLGYLDALRIEPTDIWTRTSLIMPFALIGLQQETLTVYGTTSYLPLMMLGRPEDAVAAAETFFTEAPTFRSRFGLGKALAFAGDYNRARPILEEAWKRSSGRVTLDFFEVFDAAALISIRRDAGDEAGVGELLVAIRDNVRRYREAGYTTLWYFSPDYEEGLAAYFAGEHETGLTLIARAVEDGYFMLPNEAILQTLFDDPGFAPILEVQKARQARERNRFLSIVCTDNPYEAVWQPAEGTCERFYTETQH